MRHLWRWCTFPGVPLLRAGALDSASPRGMLFFCADAVPVVPMGNPHDTCRDYHAHLRVRSCPLLSCVSSHSDWGQLISEPHSWCVSVSSARGIIPWYTEATAGHRYAFIYHCLIIISLFSSLPSLIHFSQQSGCDTLLPLADFVKIYFLLTYLSTMRKYIFSWIDFLSFIPHYLVSGLFSSPGQFICPIPGSYYCN